MDFWQRARSFAEDAAKRSHDLTKEAAKRSQDLALGTSKFSEIFSETAQRSKDIAFEASNRAEQIRIEALRRADQIKHLIEGVSPSRAIEDSSVGARDEDLERFGITEELRDFIKGITMTTFEDFPLEDDSQVSDISTVSNVRKDLSEWQEKHANLVLSTVKEISKLRYELCPRVMKERKFWRIYFILMNSHVAPFEKQYMDEVVLKLAAPVEDVRGTELPKSEISCISVENEKTTTSTSADQDSSISVANRKTTTSTSTEQDLDVFLLGDLGDSDGPEDGDEILDDDFDKMIDSSDDDDKEKL